MSANGKPNERFTLPALTPVSFSLTDGTDIPPPPDSPIEERAPPVPEVQATENRTATAPAPVNGSATSVNGAYDGHGRRSSTAVEQPPTSPTSSARPSSIRRFLSRKSMHSNYMNGASNNGSVEDFNGMGRPDSPSSFLSGPPKKKKNSSWFGRLGSSSSGSGKRTSIVYEGTAPAQQQETMGPPPPKLPELNQLKAKIGDNDEGSLGGGEMFKDIRGE